jgi:hypothetical protein
MSIHFIAFLAGLFGVPIALLALAHRVRRRSPRVQSMFRGAVIGHCVAGVVAIVWGMIPPEAWEPGERARGLAGLWSLLLLPLMGGVVGALTTRQRAAIVAIGLSLLPFSSRVAETQERAMLVGVIGHWTHVNDGGPAIQGDGTRWDGKPESAFPLAVRNGVSDFRSGTIKVDFRMVGGASDQNGGVVIGLQPNGDYLFVRYNTKDGNVAVWKYADGARTVLTHGHEHAQLPLDRWHELTVTVVGNRVTGAITGTKLTVEHALEKPLTGRVGVWTKRDAITIFRDYRVTP